VKRIKQRASEVPPRQEMKQEDREGVRGTRDSSELTIYYGDIRGLQRRNSSSWRRFERGKRERRNRSAEDL
jgi:hypothetical protein